MFENGHAILIGVGGDLPHTQRDAQVLAEILISPTKCGYPVNQVHLLTGEKATRTAIQDALGKVRRSAGTNPNATLFFYFSGHGKQVKEADSTPVYYLLPWGYNIANLPATSISGEEILKWLNLFSHIRKICLIFDCCHAGGLARFKDTNQLTLQPYPMPPELAKVLTSGKGRVAIASSRADEISAIGTRNSIFTESLLTVLTGNYLFSDDGFIRILDVFTYLSRNVPKRTSGSQNPILNVVDLQDNFAIAYNSDLVINPTLPTFAHNAQLNTVAPLEQVKIWQRMLENYRNNLLLIEQRMAEYVVSVDIPLQYKREKEIKEKAIIELENKLAPYIYSYYNISPIGH